MSHDLVLEAFASEIRKDDHVSQVLTPHAFASDAGKCSRQVAYRLITDEGENFGLGSLINFFIGNKLHDRYQAALSRVYEDARHEIRWATVDNLVTGRADSFYTDGRGRKVLVEIKSIAATGYNDALKRGSPKPDHILQCQVSAYMLKCDMCEIVYICKNNWGDQEPVNVWTFPASQDIGKREIDRMRNLVLASFERRIPERIRMGEPIDNIKRSKVCKDCAFYERCDLQGPGERQFDDFAADELFKKEA